MPFAKRGDVVHSEATSGFNNQKKSLLINGLAALGDSHHPLHGAAMPPCRHAAMDRRESQPSRGWLFDVAPVLWGTQPTIHAAFFTLGLAPP